MSRRLRAPAQRERGERARARERSLSLAGNRVDEGLKWRRKMFFLAASGLQQPPLQRPSSSSSSSSSSPMFSGFEANRIDLQSVWRARACERERKRDYNQCCKRHLRKTRQPKILAVDRERKICLLQAIFCIVTIAKFCPTGAASKSTFLIFFSSLDE